MLSNRRSKFLFLLFFLDDGRQASVHRCGVIANEKRQCLLDGYRGGQGLSSTWVVLPLTGDLVLQVCKSQKSIIVVVIIIIIIIVVFIIIIT